ncbi:MAG: hypothetical protein ACI4IS_01040 [Acutalibacteraceae bacterium]
MVTFGGLYYTIILSNIGRIAIVVAAVTIAPESFTTRFIRAVSILAAVSLVIFLGYFIGGTEFWTPLTSHLPLAREEKPPLGPQYGMFLLCFNYFDATRNSYIFGEPGEYQLVISTALFLLLFVKSKLSERERKIFLIILLITMITIQSTSGYFSLAVILVCALLSNDNSVKSDTSVIKKFLIGIIIFTVIGVTFFDGWDYFINKVLTEKIVNASGKVDFAQGTASARWNGFIRVGEYMLNHPLDCIFGIGFEGRQATGVTSCNGFANSILDYGLLTIIWLVFNYLKALRRYTNTVTTIAGIFIIMNTWFGQPVPLYTYIVVIAFTPLLVADRTPQLSNHREDIVYEHG